jgi:circadian clock protein KaiB
MKRKTGALHGKRSDEETRRSYGSAGNVTALYAKPAKKGHSVEEPHYLLRLYVTGASSASSQAIERVRAICEKLLHGRYRLEVIDIYQLPALAKGEQIVATPTLIRVLPAPLRRYIGDLSKDNALFGLDFRVGPA